MTIRSILVGLIKVVLVLSKARIGILNLKDFKNNVINQVDFTVDKMNMKAIIKIIKVSINGWVLSFR